jgi:SHS2 domain-containing protein
MKNKDYEVIEHTADIGIRVKAADLKNIFEKSAIAMFDIMAEKKEKGALKKKVRIKQAAENLDELLVSWLNELLSLSATKELIFSQFKITKLEKNILEAEAEGVDIKNYRVNKEIKAATYHELRLEEIPSGWQAEVIFDV